MKIKRMQLMKIRSVADYQFGKGAGEALFPQNVEVEVSKKTGRIRYIYLDGIRLATLRATDGYFTLSLEGAKRLIEGMENPRLWVVVKDEATPFIARGKSVFAKYVEDADEEIRPKDEVVVLDGKGEVIAVGKAKLSGRGMKAFRRGVAVQVRRGIAEGES